MVESKYITHIACLNCTSLGLGCCNKCRPFILLSDIMILLKKYSIEYVFELIELSEIPEIYLEHLNDSDMFKIYYLWDKKYYRLQTRFQDNSCKALRPGKGCILAENRPLICKIFPFWWQEGKEPIGKNFPIEINGDCTMNSLWNFPIDKILKELNLSENNIRKELKFMNRVIYEHKKMLEDANKENIPASELLNWIIKKILKDKKYNN